MGLLVELETEGVGLWDLLGGGTDVTGIGEELRVWVGVTGVSVGVCEGVEVRVRVV